jgi:hypothetical protein
MGLQVFLPIGDTVNLTATTTSSRVALTNPELGSGTEEVRIRNTGAVDVFVHFGDSTVVATLAASIPVQPNSVEAFRIRTSATHMAAITASGSAVVYATSGQGL